MQPQRHLMQLHQDLQDPRVMKLTIQDLPFYLQPQFCVPGSHSFSTQPISSQSLTQVSLKAAPALITATSFASGFLSVYWHHSVQVHLQGSPFATVSLYILHLLNFLSPSPCNHQLIIKSTQLYFHKSSIHVMLLIHFPPLME